MLKTILILFSVLKFNYGADDCVFKECVCIDFTQNTIAIECISETGSSQFPTRANPPTLKNITILIFTGYTFSQIPLKSFDGLTIEQLLIMNSTLQNIGNETFSGLTGLTSLQISQSTPLNIKNGTFSSLGNTLKSLKLTECGLDSSKIDSILNELAPFRNLQTLGLTSIYMSQLNTYWLSNFPLLSDLDLSNNNLDSFPVGFFASSPSLSVVRLNGNRLSNMSRVLRDLSSLMFTMTELELSSNSIVTLDDGINAFTNLISLILTNNSLQTRLSKMTFRNLTQLQKLYMGNNRLGELLNANDTFEYNVNLNILDLSGNQFSVVPTLGYLKMLIWLDFDNQGGKLTELRDFDFDFV